MLFVGIISALMSVSGMAHSEAENESTSSFYFMDENTRFMLGSGGQSKSYAAFLSLVVPAGMSVGKCVEIVDFGKGRKNLEKYQAKACVTDDDIEIQKIVDRKGLKRKVLMTLGVGSLDKIDFKKYPHYADKQKRYEYHKKNSDSVWFSSETVIESGDFYAGVGETGRYSIRKGGGPNGFRKEVWWVDSPCLISAQYLESDETEETYFPPEEWTLVKEFDEIVKGMRCVKIPISHFEYSKKKKRKRGSKIN